jgi:hypothetical protein
MRIERDPHLLRFASRAPTWPQRLGLTLLAAVVLTLAFLFVTLAVVVGSVLAIGIALRWWWIARRLRAAHKATAPLEGEYRVLESADLKKVGH